jgi:hypothetical protein
MLKAIAACRLLTINVFPLFTFRVFGYPISHSNHSKSGGQIMTPAEEKFDRDIRREHVVAWSIVVALLGACAWGICALTDPYRGPPRVVLDQNVSGRPCAPPAPSSMSTRTP